MPDTSRAVFQEVQMPPFPELSHEEREHYSDLQIRAHRKTASWKISLFVSLPRAGMPAPLCYLFSDRFQLIPMRETYLLNPDKIYNTFARAMEKKTRLLASQRV